MDAWRANFLPQDPVRAHDPRDGDHRCSWNRSNARLWRRGGLLGVERQYGHPRMQSVRGDKNGELHVQVGGGSFRRLGTGLGVGRNIQKRRCDVPVLAWAEQSVE